MTPAPDGTDARAGAAEPSAPTAGRAWAATVAANGVNLLLGLATGVLTARLLGPDGRGVLAGLVLLPALVTGLASLSLPTVLARDLARERRPAARRDLLAAALPLGPALGLLGALAALPLVASSTPAGHGGLAALYLLVLPPASLLGLTLLAVDHGRSRFTRYNLARLVPQAAYLAALLLLWATGQATVATLLWASFLGTALAALLRLPAAEGAWRRRPRLRPARRLVADGLACHRGAVAALAAEQADRLLVVLLFAPAGIGLYAVAQTLASAGCGALAGAFGALVLPELARLDDRAAAKHLAVRRLAQSAAALGLAAFFLAVSAPLLLTGLFGRAYADALPACLLLLAAQPLARVASVAVQALRGLGDDRAAAPARLLGLAVFLSAAWLLAAAGAPPSLAGVAVASLLGQAAALVWLLRHLARAHGIDAAAWRAAFAGLRHDSGLRATATRVRLGGMVA